MYLGNAPTDSDGLMTCLEEEIAHMEVEKVRIKDEIARMEEEKCRMEVDKAHMEAKIRQKTALLSRLRATRNSSASPILRLPPEILAIIFIHGARDFHESHDGGRFIISIPTWVNVSYVCSDWRNIALNCPTLWVYPFNVSLRWTEELLRRSKEAPLKVSCIYPSDQCEEVCWRSRLLENLLRHSERIRELHLDVPLSFLPPELSLSTPRLEKLDMNLPQGISVQSIAITDGDKLPLRTLRLVNCSLSRCSFNLIGLQTLSLHHVHSPSPANIVEFLAVLNSMPDLTFLQFEYVLLSSRDIISSGGLDASLEINLPRLALLAVVAPLSTVLALLSCINIPLKTQLSLEPLPEQGSSIGDYTPILSLLAQRFSVHEPLSSSCPIFRSLVIDTAYPMLTLSSLERDCDPYIPIVEKTIPLQISFGKLEDVAKSDQHRLLSEVCCSLPLTNVQTLHVTEPEFSSAIWKEMLGHLSRLRYIMLSDNWMPNLSMLSLTANEPQENPSAQPIHDQDPTLGHILVPALEELELVRITFIPDDAPSWEPYMSQKSLFEVLSTRKGLRDRLTMIDCEVEGESGG